MPLVSAECWRGRQGVVLGRVVVLRIFEHSFIYLVSPWFFAVFGDGLHTEVVRVVGVDRPGSDDLHRVTISSGRFWCGSCCGSRDVSYAMRAQSSVVLSTPSLVSVRVFALKSNSQQSDKKESQGEHLSPHDAALKRSGVLSCSR